jgi:hypothetical protein
MTSRAAGRQTLGPRRARWCPARGSPWLFCPRAREHRVFAGRIERGKLRFADRAITAALRVPDGDFRSWPDIEGWADGIAAELGAAA